MRTNPKSIQKVSDLKHLKKPTEIKKSCNDEFSANPINLKAIYNKKYRDHKAKSISNCQTNPEERPEGIYDNDFVKYLIKAHGYDDVIIMFYEDQIHDMRFHLKNIDVSLSFIPKISLLS